MGVFNRVVLCLVLLVPLIGFGVASATTLTATPVQIGTSGQIPGTGPQVRFETQSPTHGTRYGNALVPVSAASLGKMAVRTATTNIPLHLAIMAFVAAKDNWDWNATEHRFERPGGEPKFDQWPTTPGYWHQVSGHYSATDPADAAATCNAWVANGQHMCTGVEISYPSATDIKVNCQNCGGPGWHNIQRWVTSSGGGDPDPVPTSDVDVVTDTEIGTSLGDPDTAMQTGTINRNILQTTINNPTTINNDWPEMTTIITNIKNAFINYDVNIGDDFVDTTTEYHGMHAEFPVFCDWAGVVCSFIEWFQETEEPPEDPDLPTEEIEDVWDEWDSGMPSTGSCPAPHTTEFMGNAISIPFDDFCYGLSTYFRPIFIALALFTAGFILVGARQ